MTTVTPFLMFEGRAEEAMNRYVSALPDSRVERLDRHEDGPVAGQVYRGEAVLAGQRLRFFDSPVNHAFSFTPAVSLFVTVDNAEDLDAITDALAKDFLMPPGDYGFSQRFAWFNDEFGVSWQVSVET
jgi:predicted 3-demethylubiquinone-9 3-methyltransferase (glyoxalase superfamily)